MYTHHVSARRTIIARLLLEALCHQLLGRLLTRITYIAANDLTRLHHGRTRSHLRGHLLRLCLSLCRCRLCIRQLALERLYCLGNLTTIVKEVLTGLGEELLLFRAGPLSRVRTLQRRIHREQLLQIMRSSQPKQSNLIRIIS